MFVKPGPNPRKLGSLLKVRVPRTRQILPEAGQDVPNTAFWIRRLRDGDVVRATPPAAKPAAPAAAPASHLVTGDAT